MKTSDRNLTMKYVMKDRPDFFTTKNEDDDDNEEDDDEDNEDDNDDNGGDDDKTNDDDDAGIFLKRIIFYNLKILFFLELQRSNEFEKKIETIVDNDNDYTVKQIVTNEQQSEI